MNSDVEDELLQRRWPVRCTWGGSGARYLAHHSSAPLLAVVVDVCSFSTTVSMATDRGARVYPYRWRDAGATSLAERFDAVLAVQRSDRGPGQAPGPPSLSPASICAAEPFKRLVLPSPNGSTIASVLQELGCEVVAGCLRNARAVGDYCAEHLANGGEVLVVPAGERWPDGTMRVANEDLWGAGAILAAMPAASRSPEAESAVEAFRAVKRTLSVRLKSSSSGMELLAKGYDDDVNLIGQLNASNCVPRLIDGAFTAVRRPRADEPT
ncbi:2-phosphosulfolactate phosphatase [Calidifontibacter terrae]